MIAGSCLCQTPARARKCGLALCAVIVFMVIGMIQPDKTRAGYLDDALEAGELGVSYFQVAWTGLYQRALSEGAEAGPYDFDLIGSAVLGRGTDSNVFGNTDLVFWLFSVDNMGGLGQTGEMRRLVVPVISLLSPPSKERRRTTKAASGSTTSMGWKRTGNFPRSGVLT